MVSAMALAWLQGGKALAQAQGETLIAAQLNNSGFTSATSYSRGGDMTVEGWVYPTSAGGPWSRLVELSTTTASLFNALNFITSSGDTGRPFMEIWVGNSQSTLLAPNPLPLNTWSHVAYTIEGTTYRIYVNGSQVATGTGSAPTAVARTLSIGRFRTGGSAIDGRVADIRIWSVARTAAQIDASKAWGSITGPTTGLVACWALGQTGRDVLADSAGNMPLTEVGTVEYLKLLSGTNVTTAANTHAGTFTIAGGVYQVGNGGTSGTLGSGNVVNNFTLAFNRSDAITPANAISGTGKLVQNGSGSLTLSGSKTFTGGIDVNAGILYAAGSLPAVAGNTFAIGPSATWSFSAVNVLGNHSTVPANAIVVQAGGVLNNDGNNRFNLLPALTLNGGSIRATGTDFGYSYALRGDVTVNGGPNTSTIEAQAVGLGSTALAGATFNVADGSADIDLLVSGTLIDGPSAAWPTPQASFLTKTGAGSMVLSGANTYSGTTTISGGTLQVGNGGTTGTLGSGNVLNNATLTFNRSDTVTVANVISGTGALQKQGAGTLVLLGANTYSGASTVSAGILQVGNGGTSGALGSGNVINNAGLVFNRSDNISVPGVVQGSGTLTQQGAGTLALLGNNTYSGTTTISGGTLQVGNGGNTGTLGSGNIVNNGSLAFHRSDGVTVSSVISGTGSLAKQGASTLTLAANNTYSGTTAISAGTLQVGNGGTTGTLGTGNVVNNDSLAFQRSDNVAVANAISGSGTLTQQGAGTLVLSGANSYSGLSTISSGTLQVGAGGSAGSLGSGNLVNNGALVLNRNDAFTLANVMSGTGTLTVQGGGIATLTGANTYSGISTISAGTLQVGNGGTTGALGSGNVVNNGTLAFNRIDNITVANVVSGTGGLRKQGNGTVTLSAANSFSGATEITGGTLALGASGTLGTSSGMTISGGAALDVTARSAGLVVPSGLTLANTGGTATLRGNIDASAPTLSMSFDGTNPSFSVVNGTLTLAANTPVQVAKTGSALTAGLYKVISKGSGGTVAGVVPAAVTVTGAGGLPTSLSIVDGELLLQVGTPVTVAIGNLAQSYDATPRPVTITTTPAGIATAVTYNGSITVPTAVGTYAVVATVTAPGLYGSASGSLVISKALAIVRLGNLFQSYDGTARRALAVTEPSGLAVGFTYDGNANAPTSQGIYKVIATVTDPNYSGTTNGILRVRAATPGSLAAPTSQPPAYVNHQGFLSDSSGTPLGSPNPRNYDLVFRIYTAPSGGSSLWTELQNVTLDQGRYSVMLGDGQNVGVEPWPKIDSVLASGSGSSRYLQVTVRGIGVGGSDVTMMPRYLLTSQPYAFLARHATTADTLVDSNGLPVIRVVGNSVGVSVEQPNAMFDIGGVLAADSVATPGNAVISGTVTATSFVGGGTFPLGTIVVWTSGTAPNGWALCDGRTVNGRRTPDLRSRFVVGQGQGAGLSSRSLGQTGGEENVTLNWLNMGQHNHVFDPGPTGSTGGGNHSHGYDTTTAMGRAIPLGYPFNAWGNNDRSRQQWVNRSMDHGDGNHDHSFSVSSWSSGTGGGQAHPNMPPFYVLSYIMRVQ